MTQISTQASSFALQDILTAPPTSDPSAVPDFLQLDVIHCGIVGMPFISYSFPYLIQTTTIYSQPIYWQLALQPNLEA
jgi:hypothetical protein